MSQPFVLMIAGPNGAGKTSLTHRIREQGVDLGEYINPDDIASSLQGAYGDRVARAQSIADERRQDCIEARRSFSFETVMSHESKIRVLSAARSAGFFVQLFFVGNESAQLSVERVALRIAQGGHSVPEEKIVSRWFRSMGLVSAAIRETDRAYVFDNSAADVQGRRLVLEWTREHGDPIIKQYPPVPRWVTRYVLVPIGR